MTPGSGQQREGRTLGALFCAHLLSAILVGAAVGATDGQLAATGTGLVPLSTAAHAAVVSLAAALHLLPAALFGLAVALLIALSGAPVAAPLRRGARHPAAIATLLGLLALVGLLLWLRLRGREFDVRNIDPRGPALLGAGALVYAVLVTGLRRLPRRALLIATLVQPTLMGCLVAAPYLRAGAEREAILLRLGGEAALSSRLQRQALWLLDSDGDEFPRYLCGAGCDCDDDDRAISPGAREVPDNGIDEDCSGQDATRAEADRYSELFNPPAAPQPVLPQAEARADGAVEDGRRPGERRKHKRKRHAEHHRRDRKAARRDRKAARMARAEQRAKQRAEARAERRRQRALRKAALLAMRAPAGPTFSASQLVPPRALPQRASQAYDGTLSGRGRRKAAAEPAGIGGESRPGRANVVLITVDTLRADHLGLYGYPHGTSPRIDAWARGAAVFEQARAAGPATRFSIPAMLTGKHFTEVRRSAAEWPRIDDSEVMLPERLRDAGYFTAAFHSVIYLQDRYGFGQGFTYRDLSFFRTTQSVWQTPTAEYVTDRVLQYADKGDLGRRAPFFLWAYYGDPHAPHMKHAEFPSHGPQKTAAYDSEVAFSDHHIGRLLDGLRERGLLANTYVIFVADHGEGLDRREDHGSKHHSKNLYDELIRVPLIIAGPGVEPRRISTPVSLIDMVPTVMEVAERPVVEPWLRGESLLPYLHGESPPHRPVFAEKHRAEDEIQKCMVLWPYKVIVVLPHNDFSIYNLAEDPHERHNVIGALSSVDRDRLIGAYRYWATNVLAPTQDNPRH